MALSGGLSATSASAAKTPLGGKLPTSASFFPIAVWDQSPQGGNVPAPYANQAQAFHAMGVNTFLGLFGWPESHGSDAGELAAAAAQHMYVIGGGDPSSNTSAASVASVQALLASDPAAAAYFVGYQWLDEPSCTTNVASQIATIMGEDPGRLVSVNEGSWVADLSANDIGSPACLAQAEANLAASPILSADDYALTDPWHAGAGPHCSGANCIYLYGQSAANMVARAHGKPVWEFVETGTDDMGYSEQAGACNWTTNLCANGNEAAATPAQVNSAAWGALIGGAKGIEWFCDGSNLGPSHNETAYDACAGGGGGGNPANGGSTVIAPNITYIDATIQSLAIELNSPNVSGLTTTSSNSAVPVVQMLKDVAGTYYLFAMSNRDGVTTATFTDPALAGTHATLVYNSAQRYDPAHFYQGPGVNIGPTGSFSRMLGIDPYQVKIWKFTKP